MPHGGTTIRSGNTSEEHAQVIEYGLALESNPEFTASILVAFARAVHRLNQQGQFGAVTVFDVPPGLPSPSRRLSSGPNGCSSLKALPAIRLRPYVAECRHHRSGTHTRGVT